MPRLGIVARLILTLSGLFFLISLGAAFLVYFSQRSALIEKHLSHGRLLAETYAQATGDALETKDDILLLSYMERLKKIPDVSYAMVLATDGRVIVHTDSSKVREKFQDPISLRALEAAETIVQEDVYDGEPIHDIAVPVLVNFKKVAVFRLGYNENSINAQADNYRQQATLVLIVMIALAVLGIFAASLRVSKGFSALAMLVDSLAKGRASDKGVFDRGDEVSDIGAKIQKAMGEVKAMCDNYEDRINSTIRLKHNFVKGFGKFFPASGLLVLDDQNKIIYANQQALGIIESTASSEEVEGKHIIEVTRSSEIMGLLADAEKQPNTVISSVLSSLNSKASICTITDQSGRERVGTIIVLE